MDEMYALVREALAEADSVDVDYTPRGVPVAIWIDPDSTVHDEETSCSVSLSRL